MTNQNDRFIDEVTEDLRRDRLFRVMRRYGWIVILALLVAVAMSAWREYSKAREGRLAREFGDAVLAADASADPTARAEALAKVDTFGRADRAAFLDLLAADARLGANDVPAASAALTEAQKAAGTDVVLRDLALLRNVLAQGNAVDAAARDAALAELSKPGAPFELLALEQKAVALADAGHTDDAVALIRQIQDKDGLSQALRQRLSEMMITLGAEAEPTSGADVPPPPAPAAG
ncbi:MAG: hypothetical protein DI498_05155 [Paracoccus denitrificans]|nr:MAG: hypothetical protein DI498_05155 [Paracoccus denitrificans]PZO85304.1 MAG: hypothetical protein DI633_05155 [Paracoccus denitrificans]